MLQRLFFAQTKLIYAYNEVSEKSAPPEISQITKQNFQLEEIHYDHIQPRRFVWTKPLVFKIPYFESAAFFVEDPEEQSGIGTPLFVARQKVE